jgi:acyl-CoA hydrolase
MAVPLGPGVPGGFLHGLAGRDDWTDLDIFGALMPDLYEVMMKPNVRYRSGFFGPAERFLRDAGGVVEFVPADFRRFAPIMEQLSPRIMATVATPPDADGYMSLSLHAGASVAELHRAGADPERLLVVEISPNYPRTMGNGEHRHALHVDEADVIIETDRSPFELADAASNESDIAIAKHAAAFVPDGATLQTGIGGIPNMVATLLAEGDGGGYGIHSEMFTNGLMRLHKAGKVSNTNKGRFEGQSITTFAAGTAELYSWLDNNTEVRFLPVDVVNSPEVIAENRHMITVNGAIAIDLSGQVVADTIDGRQFSGVGGHEDFNAGAGLRLEDRSLLCLRSTTHVDGDPVSRIVPKLPTGSVVSTPRHQIDVVVTEYGTAELQGLTIRERARALASIGHPDFRDDLEAVAEVWPQD